MNWMHTGVSTKSEKEVNRLVQEVISSPDFHAEDLLGFNAHQENQQIDIASVPASFKTPYTNDDWKEVAVDIEIPVGVAKTPARTYRIPGLHYRSITQVIKATWGAAASRNFHLTPFKRIHVDALGVETRVYDEVYTSDAFETAHNNLQKQSPEPDCKLEKVIAGLMFWSDSTHLTNFGTASVWPIYMYFANLSKYLRAKPNSGACHHMAYIPSVCFIISKTFPSYIFTVTR